VVPSAVTHENLGVLPPSAFPAFAKWHGSGSPRIAAESEQVLDAFQFQSIQYGARFSFRLPYHCQVAHHLEAAPIVDRFHQIDGFFARASASPVRNGTKARIEPLNDLYFAEEVFLAFFRLWRKELDRKRQP